MSIYITAKIKLPEGWEPTPSKLGFDAPMTQFKINDQNYWSSGRVYLDSKNNTWKWYVEFTTGNKTDTYKKKGEEKNLMKAVDQIKHYLSHRDSVFTNENKSYKKWRAQHRR